MAIVLHGTVLYNAANSSRAPSVEREDQRSRRALRPEPNDRDQVACADLYSRCTNGAPMANTV